MVLAMPTLMLNKAWIPIRVTTVEDALMKLFTGAARVVDEDYSVHDFESWAELKALEGKPCIRTGHLTIRVPEVIVLSVYADVPDRKLVFSRANVYKRDRYTCQYCGKRPDIKELTIEHIVPRSKGGPSSWTNCVLACFECNSKKANKSLVESGLKLRCRPTKPDWSPSLVLARVKNVPMSWEKFVSDAYWNTELKG